MIMVISHIVGGTVNGCGFDRVIVHTTVSQWQRGRGSGDVTWCTAKTCTWRAYFSPVFFLYSPLSSKLFYLRMFRRQAVQTVNIFSKRHSTKAWSSGKKVGQVYSLQNTPSKNSQVVFNEYQVRSSTATELIRSLRCLWLRKLSYEDQRFSEYRPR